MHGTVREIIKEWPKEPRESAQALIALERTPDVSFAPAPAPRRARVIERTTETIVLNEIAERAS